jgi:hypothetical protein
MEKWVTLPNGKKVKMNMPKEKKADFDPTQGYTVHGFDKDGKPVVTWGKNYDKAIRESNKRGIVGTRRINQN